MLTMKRLLAFLIATVAATASAQNTFPASGNVGIGTTAPSYALDIQRLGYAEMRLFGNNNGAQVDTRYQALNVDGSTNYILTGVGINANNQYLIIDQLRNNDIYQYLSPATGTNEAHAWYIGGNEKMRINYLGNVGIGTNTPGAKLEVNGALKLSIGSPGITFGDGSSQTTAYPGSSANTGYVDSNGTQPGGVAIGDLMLNNTYVIGPTSAAHSYRIATLPGSTNGTFDHLHLLVTVNSSWGGQSNSYMDAVFGNRAGFSCQYSVHGAAVNGNVKLAAYSNTDGTVDIYILVAPNTYATAGYTILENQQETVYTTPMDYAGATAGTLVFDSSNTSYLPATYIDYSNNVTFSGNLKLTTGKGSSITYQDGTVQSTAWNGVLQGGDYAESVDVTGDRADYEPGDVLVIDPNVQGRFLKSSEPYATTVAGIYSTKPGIRGRRQATDSSHMPEEVPMAMIGVVPTKVTDESGSIKPGDLLVTSSKRGYAMKGTDHTQMMGAIIGKAMGHLDSGIGLMEVLVSLQ